MRRDFPPAPVSPVESLPVETSRARSQFGHRLGRYLLVAALSVFIVLLNLTAPGPAAADEVADSAAETPLTVTIDALRPAVLGPTGPLTIVGTVTNNSTNSWRDLNLHPVISNTALTTAAEVKAASETDADAVFGDRIYAPGTFDTITELAPGASATFRIRVPRAALELGETDGVYQVGVHARAPDSGSVRVTLGRDRMFLPLITHRAKGSVDATLVVPLRSRTNRDEFGRVIDLARWHQLLNRGGRLYDIAEATSGSTVALTWLVDPSVLETVEQIAQGNPVDQLLLTGNEDTAAADPETPEPTPSATEPPPSSEPSSVPVPQAAPSEATDVDEELQQLAERWLSRVTAQLRNTEVLALPYGDIDVNGAAAAGSAMTQRAFSRSTATLKRLGIEATPALDSATGRLRAATLRSSPAGTQALVSRAQVVEAVADSTESQADLDAVAEHETASVARIADRTLRVYNTYSGLDVTGDALGTRQRIVAEAAARRVEGVSAPLLVKLPNDWHPRDPKQLFSGLDQRWISWSTLAQTSLGTAAQWHPRDLPYPQAAVDAEVSRTTFDVAADTLDQAAQLTRVIDGTSPIEHLAERAVLTTLSPLQRDRTSAATELIKRQDVLTRLLGSIKVEAPERVTLSSTSGQFPGTLENDLPVPVLVQLRAETDTDLTLTSPGTLSIPAAGRRTIRLEATSERLGTHDVSLVVTDTEGYPTGARVEVPVRAASVSVIVWWVIAAGALLLVLMIVRQWRLRGLRRRATPLPDPHADRPVGADSEESSQ